MFWHAHLLFRRSQIAVLSAVIGLALLLANTTRALAADASAPKAPARKTPGPITLRPEAIKARAAYRHELMQLATWCDENELRVEAAHTRTLIPGRDCLPPQVPSEFTAYLWLPALPTTEEERFGAKRDHPLWSEWQRRIKAAGGKYADDVWQLAKQAHAAEPSLALELIYAAAAADLEKKAAWQALGYVRVDQAWRTPFAAKQLSAGKTLHAEYGWIARDHSPRYEAGERFEKGRWIAANEDAKLHSRIDDGWRLESDHFLVTTNHSLASGVRLLERLERLHAAFRVVFAGFYYGDKELATLVSGRVPVAVKYRQHAVVQFATRKEYVAALKALQPRIDITSGIYFDDKRTAYFFAGDDSDIGTIYHEATHQLFHEMRKAAPNVANKANFWAVEGVACMMESLALCDQAGTPLMVGCPQAVRLQLARRQLQQDKYYVPLDRLTQYGVASLQGSDKIAELYAQSAGLSTYLAFGDDSRRREVLSKYLRAIYGGRDHARTLSGLVGEDYPRLDAQYQAYISGVP